MWFEGSKILVEVRNIDSVVFIQTDRVEKSLTNYNLLLRRNEPGSKTV